MLEHLNAAPTKPNRVVVMGAGGFVGSAIVQRLKAEDVPVVALGRGDVDLLRPEAAESLAETLSPDDTCIAVSALAPVKNLEMLSANMVMLSNMVEALRKVPPAHLINIGSDAVFADLPLPLTEGSPKAPTALHGVMHLAREIAFAELETPLATLRPTLIYGAKDPHNGYGPNRFRRLAGAGKEIALFGEGEERRDHVLIDDVAELACAIAWHRSHGSLNCATGQVWSFRDVASMVVELFETPVPIKGAPRPGPMPHNGYRPFDAGATKAAFADFRYTQLPEGLARAHDEARELASA